MTHLRVKRFLRNSLSEIERFVFQPSSCEEELPAHFQRRRGYLRGCFGENEVLEVSKAQGEEDQSVLQEKLLAMLSCMTDFTFTESLTFSCQEELSDCFGDEEQERVTMRSFHQHSDNT